MSWTWFGCWTTSPPSAIIRGIVGGSSEVRAITDRRIPLVVVYGLVLVTVMGIGSVSILAFFEKDIPDVLNTVLSAAVGAVAAVLASTRSEPGP